MQNHIEVIARAVILRNSKMLLCKHTKYSHYYLPGGHVEFGETIEEALQRELKEELNTSTKIKMPVGVLQQSFVQEGKKRHEINFIYSVDIKTQNPKSAESHLEFHWVAIKDFPKAEIKPIKLKKEILKWIKTKKTFYY